MVTVEQVARAALAVDSLGLRILTQEFLRATPVLADVPRPETDDPRVLAAAAGLVEVFAQRSGQQPPAWTRSVGASPEPIFLVNAALRMRWMREFCLAESPEPLKRRQLYATPNFLTFA